MKIKALLILFLVNFANNLIAQPPNSNHKLTEDFIGFFAGNWTGDGEFSNGEKISADLTFKISLDSSWIIYEHTDKLPNRYKAISMWGIDMTTG